MRGELEQTKYKSLHSIRLFTFILPLILSGCTTHQPRELEKNAPTEVSLESSKGASINLSPTLLFELPTLKENEQVYERTGYWLSFNQNYKIANWVSYELTGEEATADVVQRSDNFHSDYDVSDQRISSDDYRGSGFQQGHLVPAGDMKWSLDAMNDSFLMTNITPQTEALNKGVWKTLEGRARKWSVYFEKIYVVTGPIFNAGLVRLPSGITVPKKFFKVILEKTDPGISAIAFIIPQKPNGNDLKQYAVTIDEVERQTNIDFFPQLEDDVENTVESKVDFDFWELATTNVSKVKSTSQFPKQSTTYGTCPVETELQPASISGCCSGHSGVAGPKRHRACCGTDKKVMCNDGTLSASCKCD